MTLKNSRNFRKRESKKGIALAFVLIGLLTLTLIGVLLLKNTERYRNSVTNTKSANLASVRAKAGAEVLRSKFLRQLQGQLSYLPNDPDHPGEYLKLIDIQVPDGVKVSSSASIYTPIVDSKSKFQEEYSLTCEYQIRTDTTPGKEDEEIRIPDCDANRNELPKLFKSTYRVRDIQAGVVATVTEHFQVQPSTALDFSMVISDADKSFDFGNFHGVGNMGILFKDASTGKIWFRKAAGGGAIFDGVLATNLPNASQIKLQAGATPPEFRQGVTFGAKKLFDQELGSARDKLKDTANITYDDAVADSFSSVCGSNPNCSLASKGNLIELGRATGSPPAGEDLKCWVRVTHFDNTTATPTVKRLAEGYDTNGKIFLLNSDPTFVSGGPGMTNQGSLCSNMVFLSEGPMTFASSLKKADILSAPDSVNAAFMSTGDIRIDANTRLKDGQTIAARKSSTGNRNWNLNDGPSLEIEAVLMPGPTAGDASNPSKSSNFVIDPSIYDATTAGEAVNLGNLKIKGMIASAEPPIARVTIKDGNNLKVDGFNQTEMIWNSGLALNPPTGTDFSTTLLIKARVLSSSETMMTIDEAKDMIASSDR